MWQILFNSGENSTIKIGGCFSMKNRKSNTEKIDETMVQEH